MLDCIIFFLDIIKNKVKSKFYLNLIHMYPYKLVSINTFIFRTATKFFSNIFLNKTLFRIVIDSF